MKYSLEIVVFLCGALLMVLEITGSRVLAPFVGTSLPVWTSLIGVILGFLSLGYWYGGRWADENANRQALGTTILLSSLSVFVIAAVNKVILATIAQLIPNLFLGSLVATIILFAAPSFLLGIVSPYAARLKMKSIASSGRTVGNLYALSTLGSILGTFAAGFWLIPFLGTIKILYLISGLLLVASLIVFRSRLLLLAILLLPVYLTHEAKVSSRISIDTSYSHIVLYSGQDRETQRPVRYLTNDALSAQAGMFLDNDDDLVFRYLKYFRLADFFNPGISKALAIGGAAYSFPKDFLKKHPHSSLDVVEIDPGMTKIAKEYFNLKEDPRLTIFHEDGRVFLNRNQKIYDAVYMDVFNSDANLPYQLTSVETIQKIAESLAENGVVLTNIIDGIEGDHGKFLRASYATYKKVFPLVYVLRVYPQDSKVRQNLVLVALKNADAGSLKSENIEWQGYLNMAWRKTIPTDVPILTDDFAPVEYYALYRSSSLE